MIDLFSRENLKENPHDWILIVLLIHVAVMFIMLDVVLVTLAFHWVESIWGKK